MIEDDTPVFTHVWLPNVGGSKLSHATGTYYLDIMLDLARRGSAFKRRPTNANGLNLPPSP